MLGPFAVDLQPKLGHLFPTKLLIKEVSQKSGWGMLQLSNEDQTVSLQIEPKEVTPLDRDFFGPIHDESVMAAMAQIPRDRFVPEQYLAFAYDDRPLPIGLGQTISQPFMVALMTELLELKAGDRVLEIGTGSGYQTAILAQLVQSVYTVEIIEQLSERAHKLLDSLELTNIHYQVADGYKGWKEQAPFDAIIVTAAAVDIPPQLLEQLVDGGRLVIPLGAVDEVQTLWKLKRKGEGWLRENHGPVRFVPFTRSPSNSSNSGKH